MNPRKILLDPQGGEGNGPGTPAPAPEAKTPPENVAASVTAKHGGDASKALVELVNENYKLRDKLRQAKEKAVPEGATLLQGDDLAAWEAYKTLGKPEDITATLKEHGELKGKLAASERLSHHQQIADLHGYKASVLGKLLDDSDIEIEVQELRGPAGQVVRKDGAPQKGAFVRQPDPKDARKTVLVPLPDYAREHWADFLPALAKEPAAPRIGTPSVARGQFGPGDGRPPVMPAPVKRTASI